MNERFWTISVWQNKIGGVLHMWPEIGSNADIEAPLHRQPWSGFDINVCTDHIDPDLISRCHRSILVPVWSASKWCTTIVRTYMHTYTHKHKNDVNTSWRFKLYLYRTVNDFFFCLCSFLWSLNSWMAYNCLNPLLFPPPNFTPCAANVILLLQVAFLG